MSLTHHYSLPRASLLTIGSAFFLALNGYISKSLLQVFSINLIICLNFILPAIFALIIATIFRVRIELFTGLKFHALRAVFVFLAQNCTLYYLKFASILDATVLMMTSPFFIAILSFIVYRHHIRWVTWVAMVMSFLGIVMILKPGEQLFQIASIIGLASGFCIACSQVLMFHNAKSSNTFSMMISMYLIAGLLTLPGVLFSEQPLVIGGFDWEGAPSMWLMALLAISSFSNQQLRGLAYKYVRKAASVAPYLYVVVLFSTGYDYLYDRSMPDLFSWIGIGFVIGAGAFNSIMLQRIMKSQAEEQKPL